MIGTNQNRFSVDLEIDSMPRSILGDELRLRQILLNLISNSAKFTEGGSIALRVRGTADGSCVFEVSFWSRTGARS